METIPTRYYTVKDVARTLHLSESLIRRYIDSGELVCVRFGRAIRISSAAVERLVEERLQGRNR